MSAAKAGDLQPQEQRPDAFLASQKLDEQNYAMDGQEQDGGIESGEVPAAVSGIEGTGSTGSQYMYGNGGGSEYIPPHERMYQVNGNSEANGNTPTTQDDIDVQPARNGGGYVPPHMRQKQQAMQALALGGAAPPPPPPPKSPDTENSGGVKKMHGDSGEGVSKVEKDELYLKSVNKRVAYFEKQGSISKIMDDMRATIRMARTKSSGAQASAIGAMGQAQEQALSQTQNSMQQESAPYATEQPQVTVQTINEGGVILDRDTQEEQEERDEVEAVLQEEEEPEKQEEGGHREIQEAAPEVVQQVCNDVQSLDIQDEPNTEVECAELFLQVILIRSKRKLLFLTTIWVLSMQWQLQKTCKLCRKLVRTRLYLRKQQHQFRSTRMKVMSKTYNKQWKQVIRLRQQPICLNSWKIVTRLETVLMKVTILPQQTFHFQRPQTALSPVYPITQWMTHLPTEQKLSLLLQLTRRTHL
eukprot:TRINITY_DN2313_c1_g1_i1.p1 TRINITY_DN2313_c1_g1~~TRINITY_DN2313_c1_g1_i1.p1  ORF type:complete len:471 (-),score=58.34 TRINITY_DN2313_c1_g1_i1:404-1816(-)